LQYLTHSSVRVSNNFTVRRLLPQAFGQARAGLENQRFPTQGKPPL
jgi:hypothetical protein